MKKITIEEVRSTIIASMTEYIINYADANGAWADWDDSEAVRAELNDYKDEEIVGLYEECDSVFDVIDDEDLDFYEIYREALEAACNKFGYKISLSSNDTFGNFLAFDVWYAKDKNRLAHKVYDDCTGFEFSDEKFTEEQLYAMIEEL